MNDLTFQKLVLVALRLLLRKALGSAFNVGLASWEDQVLKYLNEQNELYDNVVHK